MARSPLIRGLPIPPHGYTLNGGDAFETSTFQGAQQFDVIYAGCSIDPSTAQLDSLLRRLRVAAVFNIGTPGMQSMVHVTVRPRKCTVMLRVNYMMCESSQPEPGAADKHRRHYNPSDPCELILTQMDRTPKKHPERQPVSTEL